MALNEMIAQGAQFKMPDPLEQYGRIAQIQQAQNQNALAQYQLGTAQRGDVQQNALYRRLQDPTFDQNNPENLASLAQFGTPGIAAIKGLTEARNAALTGSKIQGDIREQQRKNVDRIMLDLSGNPSDEKINSVMQAIEADPAFPAAAKTIAKNGLSGMLGMSIDERKQSLSMIGMTAAERYAATKPQVVGAGASLMVPGSTTPLYTQPAVATPSPLSRLQVDLAAATDPKTRREIQARIDKETSHPLPTRIETKINAYVPASEAAQTEFMKEARVTYSALKGAQPALDNIEAAKALVPTAKGFMGTGGEPLLAAASFLNNRLGTKIDTKGVTDATELRSRLFFGIVDNLKKLDSQPSQAQQAALQEALGSLGTDPSALGRVLDAFGDSIRTKVDLHNAEMSDAVSRGVKFPYNPRIALKPKGGSPSNPHAKKTDEQIKKELGL